ncbi:exodeoxyribonuclease V subunit alpha [Rhodoferax sp.]|uniref:exodeoxyribonuclease V subunit alpha n=1 Tax=Rhodoferax sp. TaxID=50421 RepID=UPI00261E40CE|nr:exodeoxyribonuclease V subunit alpha [Rhodoferax sp.]MDD2917833.1 exodeoxyribonuclease V subunit alpha [Rhodoferax sp.]
MSASLTEDDALALTGLDRALVAFLQAEQPSPDPLHSELAARVSHQFSLGHACLDLNTLAPELRQSAASLPWIEGPNSPLVLDGARLYLRRNWQAEQNIRTSIAARLAQPCPVPENLKETLAQLFEPGQPSAAPDWQKVACALAARKRFTLITGGPGTGKTTTVVRLLALLQADPAGQQTPLRIALAAPTGKAAARLGESIASAVQKLPEHLRRHIPTQAVTLHKLLQVRSNLAQDTVLELAVDLVVVDEASMIDLDMMARLLAAVPLTSSLILLGDKDQLASVEAGAVMGQLCADADQGNYNPDTLAWLAQTTGADVSAWAGNGSALAQQTVMLRLSHRFADDSGIGQWARAVNAGDSATVERLWQQAPTWQLDAPASVAQLQPGQAHDPRLKALVRQGWQAWLQQLEPLKNSACSDAQALAALKAFANFQVLCAVRDGPWGVDSLNQRIAASLGLPGEGWYAGRPVMVTRNDYHLKLMNGDVGLCLNHARGLRVAFPDGQGGMRWVLPARLDAVETVFAMTVHKSQGSEFDHVALVLPDRLVAVLTRELLYTGMTRAREQLTLVVPQAEVLLRAVGIKVQRSGGLADLFQRTSRKSHS